MNLRKEARGRPCQIRIPGICNGNPETSVLCHLPGAGMALKSDDRHAAIGCSDCHDCVDSRNMHGLPQDERRLHLLEGIIRTQKLWISEGLM